MRYFLSVIDDTPNSGTSDEMVAIDAFNEQLQHDGHWIMAEGIQGPDQATLIDNRASAGLATKGPWCDAKEFISGFWIIEAHEDAVIGLASAASKACNRKVEVRPLYG